MALTTEHAQVGDPAASTHGRPDISHLGRTFSIVAATCALFVVNTTVAMFLYPGGAVSTATSHGYQFFLNFFSDLGRTRTESGALNYPSMLLFSSAMIAIGAAAAAFFVTFARYFATHQTTTQARRLNRAATVFGLLAAVCFAGVGLTPANLVMPVHLAISNGAFDLLMAAILLEIGAIRRTRSMPAALLWLNVAFVVILIAYIGLEALGPATTTRLGAEINVTGQKIIVYTAIATIFSQALLLRAHLARPSEA